MLDLRLWLFFKGKVFLITFLIIKIINLVQSALSGELHPRPGEPIAFVRPRVLERFDSSSEGKWRLQGGIAQRARAQVL